MSPACDQHALRLRRHCPSASRCAQWRPPPAPACLAAGCCGSSAACRATPPSLSRCVWCCAPTTGPASQVRLDGGRAGTLAEALAEALAGTPGPARFDPILPHATAHPYRTARRAQHHRDGAGRQGPHLMPGQVREGGALPPAADAGLLGCRQRPAQGSWAPGLRPHGCQHLCRRLRVSCAACKSGRPSTAAVLARLLGPRSGLLTIGPRFGGAIDDAARYFKQACDAVRGRGDGRCSAGGAAAATASAGGAAARSGQPGRARWQPHPPTPLAASLSTPCPPHPHLTSIPPASSCHPINAGPGPRGLCGGHEAARHPVSASACVCVGGGGGWRDCGSRRGIR